VLSIGGNVQCVAACCGVLQCGAVQCDLRCCLLVVMSSVLQRVAVCCSVLQCSVT